MIEKPFEELVSRDLDGESSPEDRRRLDEYLDRNPEARRDYAELREVDQFLREVDEVEPPRELRQEILTSLREQSPRNGVAGRRGIGGVLDGFQRLFTRRYAYGLAASMGIAICVVVVLVVMTPGEDPADRDSLYGTITADDPSGTFQTATQSVAFNEPPLSGSARVDHGQDAAVAELHLESDDPVRVVILLPSDVEFDAFRASDAADHNVTRVGQELTFDHRGVCDFSIHFTLSGRSSDPLRLRCFLQETLLLERTLDVMPR